ncbi:MAG: hypothetical protein AB8E87_12745 [Prochlorococcus sp.]
MTYEPGTTDCRLLIEAKENVEGALRSLKGLPQTDHIRRQLVAVYNQLEGMHDLKRAGGSGYPSALETCVPQ